MLNDASLVHLIRHPLKVRSLEVKTVTRITSLVARVTLSGAELAGFVSLAPEDHVKVFFPAEGETVPVLPTIGPEGWLRLPEDSPKPIARDFTVRRHDPEMMELDIDFFCMAGA